MWLFAVGIVWESFWEQLVGYVGTERTDAECKRKQEQNQPFQFFILWMVLNILLFPSNHLQFGKEAVKKQKCCFCSEWSIIKCLARFVIGAINPCGQNCCNSLQQNMQKAIYQLSRVHTHTRVCWKLLFLPSLKVGSYSIVWVAYFFQCPWS